MFMLNDQPLALDVAFTHDDIQYPANWLRLASPEERAAIGITEVAEPEAWDDRYYWGVGHPKEFSTIVTLLTNRTKATAFSLLAPTDYVDLRNLRDPSYKPEVMAERAAIRAACADNLAAIAAATTVEQLAAIQFTWPSADVE